MKLGKSFYAKVSVILYVVTAFLLYNLQYMVYAQTIDFMFTFALIYPPLAMFLSNMNKNIEQKDNPTAAKPFVIAVIILGLFLLIRNKYNFTAYVVLAISSICCIIEFFSKEKSKNVFKEPRLIASAFASVILAAMFFVYVINPCSYEEARSKVLSAGYTNVTYSAYSDKDDNIAEGIILQAKSDAVKEKPGCYIFKGYKNDKEYCILVNISDGSVILETPFNMDQWVADNYS